MLELFAAVKRDFGEPSVVVYNAGAYLPKAVIDTSAEEFERCWRIGCFGGFLVGREAARAMVPKGRGSILFTGATASLRGGANFVNLAVGKFGLRAVAQSMARELGPKGVHVAHVIIDGQIAAEHRPAAVATSAGRTPSWTTTRLPRPIGNCTRSARSAWTLEMDLRPWVEKF